MPKKLASAAACCFTLIITGATPAFANSWRVYGCTQGMVQKYGNRFSEQQNYAFCKCRSEEKRTQEECKAYLGLE